MVRPMYERVAVEAAPETVVASLRELLRERGIMEYAVVDHGRDMAAAGQTAYPAWTLIFGNPAAGARVLAHDLAAAVDVPLRLAVIRRDGGSEVVFRDMRTLLDLDVADGFTDVLRGLADDARDRAREPLTQRPQPVERDSDGVQYGHVAVARAQPELSARELAQEPVGVMGRNHAVRAAVHEQHRRPDRREVEPPRRHGRDVVVDLGRRRRASGGGGVCRQLLPRPPQAGSSRPG
jgi:uncharacterized protein (DUF302 family)